MTGSLRDEVVELAQALIRLDTSNPPGNETPAARLIAEYLEAAGVECELVGPDPERLNLVARIPGSGRGPSMMLLAHTDVVPAPSDTWTVDPFGATVTGGRLIGRGAVDMKNELAARVVAVAALARSGERPAGDVVLVAEADEERNISDVGMSWLVRERPDLRCDFAINEGGGARLDLADGRTVVTVAVGEKIVTSLRLRVFGTAGHASVPTRTDNALLHASSADRGAARLPGRRCRCCRPSPPRWRRSARRTGAGRGDRVGRRPAPAPGRRAARGDPDDGDADRAAHVRARERDPAVRRRDLRLPGAARPGRGRHRRARRARARRRVRLRARAARAAGGRHRVADRHAALRGPARVRRRPHPGRRAAAAARQPGSPTRTTCARSGGRSPTVSRRCSSATSTPTWTPRTPPTRRSRSRTWSRWRSSTGSLVTGAGRINDRNPDINRRDSSEFGLRLDKYPAMWN